MNRDQLRERLAQWNRFNAWEAEQPPRRIDLAKAWAWYEGTWTAAQEFRGAGDLAEEDEEKLRYIRSVEDRLARLPCRK